MASMLAMKKTQLITKFRKARSKGFTLIELMLTIMVLSIGLMVAVPSFISTIERNRVASNANLLVGALNYGRVEATKQGRQINVGVIDPLTGQWGVWRDADADDAYDAGEEIRVFDALPDTLVLTSALDTYTFLPTGFADAAGTLKLCSSANDSNGSLISVALSGRVQAGSVSCP